jgi:hypothetical protein
MRLYGAFDCNADHGYQHECQSPIPGLSSLAMCGGYTNARSSVTAGVNIIIHCVRGSAPADATST